jgi:hypothetical protein
VILATVGKKKIVFTDGARPLDITDFDVDICTGDQYATKRFSATQCLLFRYDAMSTLHTPASGLVIGDISYIFARSHGRGVIACMNAGRVDIYDGALKLEHTFAFEEMTGVGFHRESETLFLFPTARGEFGAVDIRGIAKWTCHTRREADSIQTHSTGIPVFVSMNPTLMLMDAHKTAPSKPLSIRIED